MDRNSALNVWLTVDTEIWCGGWQDIDARFPGAFESYIYGRTRSGDHGLPLLLEVLRDHGLKGVFFVEPLFALRVGLAPLQEIVGLIQDQGQSVELHLHTEWVDEIRPPILPDPGYKRQHIKNFSYQDQCVLLEKGRELLLRAGAREVRAFRAGNFGANNDTLRALGAIGIHLDSSYNPAVAACEIVTGPTLHQASSLEGVLEIPMSTFTDGLARRRHAGLTACSFAELEAALHDALREKWENFVVLTHSFELLNGAKTRRNSVVARRFVKLCEFLSRSDGDFVTADFTSTDLAPYERPARPIRCGVAPTLVRLGEQVLSRLQ